MGIIIVVSRGIGENHPGAHAAVGLVNEQALTVGKMVCGQPIIKLTILN
jgi:hypothetical protein